MIQCYDPARPCPVECQSKQLLEEFREFIHTEWREHRDQVQQWRAEDTARIVALEVRSKDISGNGQPGRMKFAEDAIGELQKTKYWASGWAAGIAAIVALTFELIRLKVGH